MMIKKIYDDKKILWWWKKYFMMKILIKKWKKWPRRGGVRRGGEGGVKSGNLCHFSGGRAPDPPTQNRPKCRKCSKSLGRRKCRSTRGQNDHFTELIYIGGMRGGVRTEGGGQTRDNFSLATCTSTHQHHHQQQLHQLHQHNFFFITCDARFKNVLC